MQDYKKLADALIKALRESTEAGLFQLEAVRRNTFEDDMNRAASRGTLYSTSNAVRQTRYDTEKYLPARAEMQGKQLQREIGIKSDLLDTKTKIDSMKRAAKELNGITFDHLLV